MGKTNIPWADSVWNPITGCTKCSPGCLNCYAEVMAKRLRGMGQKKYRDGFALTLHDDCLTEPLKWKKPQTVFVCSMSDLFHPDVPDAFLDRVFTIMLRAKEHTFIVCTKRAERMRAYLSCGDLDSRIALAGDCFPDGYTALGGIYDPCPLPLPNVHLGVTVESQEQIERAYTLFGVPAASHWLSVEPLLGRVDLAESWRNSVLPTGVIVGCESGPHRRPCNLDWVRQVVDDCAAAGVLCHVKQLDIGGKVVTDMAKFPGWARVRQLAWDKEGGA